MNMPDMNMMGGNMPQRPDNQEAAMARADLYKSANYSFKLFKMIQDGQELEGWVQAKITKAADYIASVYHYMEYEMKFNEYGKQLDNSDVYSESVKQKFIEKLTEARVKMEKLRDKNVKDLDEGWDDMVAAGKKKASEKGTGKFDKKELKPGVTQYTRKSSTFTDGGKDTDTKKAEKKSKVTKEEVDKSKIPAAQRKAKGGDWKVNRSDLDKEASKSPTSKAGLDAKKKALGMKEALKGGQKKLDVDKDGKLEKSDFAKLRGGKKVNEAIRRNKVNVVVPDPEMDKILAKHKNAVRAYIDELNDDGYAELDQNLESDLYDYHAARGNVYDHQTHYDISTYITKSLLAYLKNKAKNKGVAEGSNQDDPYKGTTTTNGKIAARNGHKLGKTYTNPHSPKYHKDSYAAWERDYNSETSRLKKKGVAEERSAHSKLVRSITSRMKDTPQPQREPKDAEEKASQERMANDKAAIANMFSKKTNEGDDKLAARKGVNSVNKVPRKGQTDLRNIPAGNYPGTGRPFSDKDRAEQPNRLKADIKGSLGKQTEPTLPEGDRHTLTKKMTKQMYSIDKNMGGLAKSTGRTGVDTGLKSTKSDMQKAVKSMGDSAVKSTLSKVSKK